MVVNLDCSHDGTPLQYSCLENPMDGGAWWAAVHGVARVYMTERLYFHFSLSRIGEGNGNPLQCSCLENPRDGGAWWAAVCGVAQSRTRLKRLSSSCSSMMELTQFSSSALEMCVAFQKSHLNLVGNLWSETGSEHRKTFQH